MWETQETQVQPLGQEDHLEEEMATHSSTLAQRIPWTEEPGGLLAMVSQHSDRMRLSHNWAHEHIMVTVKGRDPEGLHRLSTWRRLQQREGTSLVASTVKNLPAMTGDGFSPWVRKIPWRKEWLLTPVFLPGEFHRQRWAVGYLVGYRPWGR